MTTAEFLANLIANVGTTTEPVTADTEPAPEPAAPGEITHMLGFTTTNGIHIGGTVTIAVSFDGFHNRLRRFPVVKVNRASVVITTPDGPERIPARRVITYRAPQQENR